ncbi:acyltransferase family protein [Bradyrhizobium huanghuaihaiense]|nr:acyltransferase [Bradyrhizobium huanghuaihaiense]
MLIISNDVALHLICNHYEFRQMQFWKNSMTLEDKIAAANGRPTGFDYLRLALALSVVAVHIFQTGLGDEAASAYLTPVVRPLVACILPMFFALSGFLVAGSLVRTQTLPEFFALRIIRLAPALIAEVVLSAFVIGALFTALPLSEYFSHPKFWAYLLNIIGYIHFTLPGVFLDNPRPNMVNQQLWTIPWELDCYIVLGALAFAGLKKSRTLLIVAIVAAHIFAMYWYSVHEAKSPLTAKAAVLPISFLVGVLFYFYASKIKWSFALFGIALAVSYLLLRFPNGDLVVAVPLTYVTVFLGVANPARNKLMLSGDYSYGIYLYGFPLQQAFAHLWPGLNLGSAAAVVATVCFAAFSWWCVERPALGARKLLKKIKWPARLRLSAPDRTVMEIEDAAVRK